MARKITTFFEDAAKTIPLFPRTLTSAITDADGNTLDQIIEHIEEEIAGGGGGFDIDKVYPVGAIYMSVDSTDPGTLFGGTWEAIQDKFLLSAGSTYTAGDTGGNATHSHTFSGTSATTSANNGNTGSTAINTNQMPSHSHSQTVSAYSGGSGANTWSGDNKSASAPSTGAKGGGQGHTHTLNNHTHTLTATGTIDSSSTLPPYLVVYTWKRTA